MEESDYVMEMESFIESSTSLRDNTPRIAATTDTFSKTNGDHGDKRFYNSDEDTCSSSSSSSSRNLVIDQPDISSQGSDDMKPKVSKKEHKTTRKRKLSLNEESMVDKKRPHLEGNMVEMLPKCTSVSDSVVSETEKCNKIKHTWKQPMEYTDFRQMFKGLEKNKDGNKGHLQEYAQYLGLQPAGNIKCFKCHNNNFESLLQLRDHQKLCFFKDRRRNSAQIEASATETINLSSNSCSIMESVNKQATQASAIREDNILLKQQIDTNTSPKAKRKVFLCSACGTYYQSWNLFLHMREVHNRHICLYCIGMFPTAERLTLHLEMKHDLEQNHFDCREKLLRSSRDSCYLMCCICEHLFAEHEDFSDHVCSELIQPCPMCGQKSKHSPNCKVAQANRLKRKEKTKNKSKIANSKAPESSKRGLEVNNRIESPLNLSRSAGTSSVLKPPENYLLNENKTSKTDIPAINVKVNGIVKETDFRRDEEILDYSKIGKEAKILEKILLTSSPLHRDVGRTEMQLDKRLDNSIIENKLEDDMCIQGSFENEDSNEKNINNFCDQTKPAETSFDSYNTNTDPTTESSFESTKQPTEPSPADENIQEIKPLLVPKFKIKIPKEFQTPLESEQSSTESDDDEIEQPINMDIESAEEESPVVGEERIPEAEEGEEDYNKDDTDQVLNSPNLVTPKNLNDEVKNIDNSEEQDLSGNLSNTTESKEGDLSINVPKEKPLPEDGILLADDDTQLIELSLNQPLDKITMRGFLRICLHSSYRICLYCNHARRIAVNGNSLALHLISQHRFSATVDSITAEELLPLTIVSKLKSFLPDLEESYFNLETYDNMEKENMKPYEKIFECFQCRFETRIHKELYLHNRKMHLKTAILCFMCRSNFFSYSELLCHMCPGAANKCAVYDIQFRCCLCDIDRIPSAFRLMVHLRKKHFACDVCLEDCQDQSRLSSHAWKHKLHHLCYRCGIAYRNKPDITKHLFWKHGTESVLCKRCLQKRWPHVYHFCIPPSSFVCEVCSATFTRAMSLKVHKRLHTGDAPYPCTEDNCEKKFISRKLLLKHVARHSEINEKPEVKIEKPVNETIEPSEEESKVKIENEENSPAKTDVKKKRKKSKKDSKENIDDLMNLPAPNLSESDSSDESDCDKPKHDSLSPLVPKVMLSPASDVGGDDQEANQGKIMDIWENFKSFKASQVKSTDDDDFEEPDIVPLPPILHVTQSDHDYCMMYKLIKSGKSNNNNEDENSAKNEKATTSEEAKKGNSISPKKKQKSPKKSEKSGSDSSSSGSSSNSDSSCSCGSNCSCSSSGGSSSDSSSSSDDSDSSTSEGKRRIAARRAAKQEKRNRGRSETSPKANTSDILDVVNSDIKPQDLVNPDDIILESDLETDESETDEDFYDEHPQKLANQLLAEKRKQLMMQTCLSPSHNFDIVENSRPSTPSLPEEMIKEKKVKIKKKKKERKTPKNNSIPTFKLNIPSILGQSSPDVNVAAFPEPLNSVPHPILPPVMSAPIKVMPQTPQLPDEPHAVPHPPIQPSLSSTPISIAAPVNAMKNRLSTGSSSDADAPLKRSKRRRRPNRFYGYSSDDDSIQNVSGPAVFKPTPPPNLTWRKEDLPTPRNNPVIKPIRLPVLNIKKSATPSNTPPLPPIPPIIIRPSAIMSNNRMPFDQPLERPPVVEPIRVPPVPVHHIQPPSVYGSSKESNDSESSDDDKLHITATVPASTSRNQSVSLPVPVPIVRPAPVKNIPPALLPNPDAGSILYFQRNNIRYPVRPPAGARPPREGESVYCYCRCPYDEVSEMIACDGDDCAIEWFHFECVGIIMPPKGKWFCPECKPKYPSEIFANFDNT